MNVRERAAYAWGRIIDLFRPKKPEIEVEIEELSEENANENTMKMVEMPEETEIENRSAPVAERLEEEETVPSRMTDEYKAWLAEQLASDETPDRNDS